MDSKLEPSPEKAFQPNTDDGDFRNGKYVFKSQHTDNAGGLAGMRPGGGLFYPVLRFRVRRGSRSGLSFAACCLCSSWQGRWPESSCNGVSKAPVPPDSRSGPRHPLPTLFFCRPLTGLGEPWRFHPGNELPGYCLPSLTGLGGYLGASTPAMNPLVPPRSPSFPLVPPRSNASRWNAYQGRFASMFRKCMAETKIETPDEPEIVLYPKPNPSLVLL